MRLYSDDKETSPSRYFGDFIDFLHRFLIEVYFIQQWKTDFKMFLPGWDGMSSFRNI